MSKNPCHEQSMLELGPTEGPATSCYRFRKLVAGTVGNQFSGKLVASGADNQLRALSATSFPGN